IFLLIALFSWPVYLSQAQTEALKEKAPFKVAILPVTIHSPENLEYMRAGLVDMLSSRIELEGRILVVEKSRVKKALSQIVGEINIENAKKIGEILGVDYVVFGSLTKLGDSASLDLKLLKIKEEKPASPVFVQAKKMEEIVARVDELALHINEKILGYSLKPAVVEKPAPGTKEKELAAIPISPLEKKPQVPVRATGGGEFWQSQSFPFQIKGLAVDDFDGDGRNEVALIDERNLYIYRWETGEFKLLWKFNGKTADKYLAVDGADIDKDGKVEIFVTNIQSDRLASFVVAFKEGAFRQVASDLDWFLRVVEWEEKGKILLGQGKGQQAAWEGPISELSWKGKDLKEISKAPIPKGIPIYSFAPFKHDNRTDFIYIDSDFRMKMMNSQGKVIWRSKEIYGSENSLQIKSLTPGTGPYEGDEFAFVNVRLVAKGKEIIVIRNISPIGDFFKRQKYFNKGEVQSLIWTGAMFMENWKSREISGYLADFQIQDLDGDQKKELIIAVNLPRESILSLEKNSVLLLTRWEGGN
ncbi:MAG: FG-GAP-like repeat-containing protein, partial [Thermodesulfobacteriota bacterium]